MKDSELWLHDEIEGLKNSLEASQARVEELEIEVNRQHEGWTDCHQVLQDAACEAQRYRKALEEIAKHSVFMADDAPALAREALNPTKYCP
jgi:hypothetical protein